MLDALGYAATRIVGSGDWRAGVQDLLDRLGAATGVSRVSLFEVHSGRDGSLVESCRYDWAEPPLDCLSGDPRYTEMPLVDEKGELDDWTVRRRRGEVVQALLRDLTGYNRQVFLEQGTLSFISVPIMLREGCWGFLGFDDCKTERVWSALEIDVLRTAAALIAGSMERAADEERLRLSEERYALAARGANDGLWDWDLVHGRAYFSPRLCEIVGVAECAFGERIDALFERLEPADAASARSYLKGRFSRHGRKFRFEARLLGGRPHQAQRWIVARGMVVYSEGKPVRVVGSVRDISEFKQTLAELRASEKQRASLARHFSPNMVDEILAAGSHVGETRELTVTVLFADLMDFTALAATMRGAQVIALLREFHGLVEAAVFGNSGTLDKYMGDGLMATFGTPRPGPRDATNAVACARQLIAALNAWNRRRAAAGEPAVLIGIGLHCGGVTLGNVGSARRLELTVVGDTVNVASRIEAMSRPLQTAILASQAVVDAVVGEGRREVLAGFRDLGIREVRGRREPVRLWGLTARAVDEPERGDAAPAPAGVS